MADSGTILITGGTGYLGSHLAQHMLEEKGEKDIVLFDRYPDIRIRDVDRVANVRDKVTIVQGDVGDAVEVFRVMKRYDVERVVHLAFNLDSWAGNDPHRWMRVNATGSTNVFEAALQTGVKRVVYASSAAVYGTEVAREYREPVTEDTPPAPTTGRQESTYGVCKLLMEMLAEVYWQKNGLDTIGMRPTATFGLAKNSGTPDLPNDEVAVRIELAALGEPIVLPPDDQYFDWMYAADAAEAWYLALTAENPRHRVFNMTSGAVPMGEITANLRKLLPEAKITVSTETFSRLHLMSNQRLRDLGFTPKYTIAQGLHRALSAGRAAAGLPALPPLSEG